MNTQFNSLMSLGTSNCWTRCPWGRITILLAVPSGQGPCWLRVPPSWPWLTRQALLREPAGRHVSRDRGRWPQQATGCYKLGHTITQGPPALGLPQPRGHASPCVTLASPAHLISLSEGSDNS